MIVIANSGLINFKKTGTIRTRGVLSKKGEKKALDFFLVLLPQSQLWYFYRYHPHIKVFLVVPKVLLYSRYQQLRAIWDKFKFIMLSGSLTFKTM